MADSPARGQVMYVVRTVGARRADPRVIGLQLGDADKNLLSSGHAVRSPAAEPKDQNAE